HLGYFMQPVFVVCVAKVRIIFELAIVSAIFFETFFTFCCYPSFRPLLPNISDTRYPIKYQHVTSTASA
ncbi:MAG: hypothetical protein K2L55_07635, partial [Muribaculaceae bacterium]|nr:hypothetical protein [Muribaculaceae bacterium]